MGDGPSLARRNLVEAKESSSVAMPYGDEDCSNAAPVAFIEDDDDEDFNISDTDEAPAKPLVLTNDRRSMSTFDDTEEVRMELPRVGISVLRVTDSADHNVPRLEQSLGLRAMMTLDDGFQN